MPKQWVDHLGNKFDSETKMCQHWNINQRTFQYRQQHGWSLEESLCTKKINNGKTCVDHLGNKFDSIEKMCQYWKIEQSTFRSRRKLGWSLEKSLCDKNGNSKQCIDHLGNKFDSKKEMCQHWNINQRTFRFRQRQGWSLKESLCGRQLNKTEKICVDHLGNKFDSETKMCQYWGINPRTFRARQRLDWSLKESLCGKNVIDHFGNKFDSQKDMCQHWNTHPATFYDRQKHGWSLKESLCGRQSSKRKKRCTDHLGNKFDSERKMCQHWNISQGTFQDRQKHGWSLEESLCAKKINNGKTYVDHLGNKFNSQKEMCGYWNVNTDTFQDRQKHGWSLKESLCGRQLNKSKKTCIDHLGNKFDSITKMCQYWNISRKTFQYRQKNGWSLLESLGIIPRLNVTAKIPKTSFQNYQLTPNITIIDNVPDTDCYFICLVDNKDKTIYHKKELIDEYIKYNKK